jgi:hypothetical protein
MSETPPDKETAPSGESAPPAAAAKPADAAKPAAAPAGEAKPAPKAAPKPAAKPAAKPKVEKKPLIDNQDGTITDPNSGLMWKQTDAWLDMHKFYTWQDQPSYIEKLNKEKFAGHSDWRIPTKADAATLVEKGRKETVIDKNGTPFPMDPIFTEGCVSNTWISECTEEEVIRFDFKIGSDLKYPPAEIWASIWAMREVAPKKEEAEEAKKEPSEAEASKTKEPAPTA